jgi:hypothetical protein
MEEDAKGRWGILIFVGEQKLCIPDQALWEEWRGDPVKLVPATY